jgi:hypothetical protein
MRTTAHHLNTHLFLPVARFCARACANLCSGHPRTRGVERRETFGCSGTRWACAHASKTRVNALMTPHARRLVRHLASRDAGRSPLGAGGFGLRAALLSPAFAPDRIERAARTQVVVPGGGVPSLPGQAVTSRRRRTPLPAPLSGSPLERALNERGCESLTWMQNVVNSVVVT